MLRKCTKVLPTVFEDSLSYYEVLCKYGKYIEELYGIIDGGILEYIEKNLNSLIFKCSYNESEEEILFSHEVVTSGEDIHVYDDNTDTIYVKSKE